MEVQNLWWLIIGSAGAGVGIGIVIGLYLDYYLSSRYLQRKIEILIDHIITMRRQGFVPQYELKQRREIDLTLPER